EAVAATREALRLKSDYSLAYYNLGAMMRQIGDNDEAVRAFRQAVAHKPDFAEARCALGNALRQGGRFAEALTGPRTGHELGLKRAHWQHPSAQWLRACEQQIEFARRLPAVLKGEVKPADPGERSEFAAVCAAKQLHADAVRLFQEAFAARPELATG